VAKAAADERQRRIDWKRIEQSAAFRILIFFESGTEQTSQ